MHVVMVSDHETFGGAAIAASRLAEGLRRIGHRVTRIVKWREGKTREPSIMPLSTTVSEKVGVAIDGLVPSANVGRRVATHIASNQLRRALKRLSPDVVNIHNIHGGRWGPELVQICAQYAPTAWTLHDMWSFTGRCIYSYECRKFLDGCDDTCPTPHEYPALVPSRIAEAFERRRRIMGSHPRLVAVCPSRWLAREARVGLWKGHRVEVIPNGLPLETFRPMAGPQAKEALKIEPAIPALLVSAFDPMERRKGLSSLPEALRHATTRPLTVLSMGRGAIPLDLDGVLYRHLGFVPSERKQALVYSAADAFIHPAPVDNFPNVVLEATACGTPTIAFPVGGIPEIVRPGTTGWLAPSVTPRSLGRTIDIALREIGKGMDCRTTCRSVAETEFSLDLQAARYDGLFRNLAG